MHDLPHDASCRRVHVPWPETGAWIGERLPSVIDDRGLIRALADVIEEYGGGCSRSGPPTAAHQPLAAIGRAAAHVDRQFGSEANPVHGGAKTVPKRCSATSTLLI